MREQAGEPSLDWRLTMRQGEGGERTQTCIPEEPALLSGDDQGLPVMSPRKFASKVANMAPECETALSELAPLIQDIINCPEATFSYDILSGALLWSDELPDFRLLRKVPHWTILRFVLRFRMTLILGQPDEDMREYWDKAQQLFPQWPGFSVDRRSPELLLIARAMEADSNKALEAEIREWAD
jgi:hypothetical protein